jgi:hypothetical protein
MNPIVFQTKAIINTFIRLIPIGLYFGTLIMGILFTDIRAFVLFAGYFVNDLMSYGFRQLFQTVDLPNCSIVQSTQNFYTMPASHTQTIAFTAAYFLSDMYQNQNFNVVNFIFLTFLLLVTMWSRTNIGCESAIDAIFATIIGMLIGIAYYRLTINWYNAPQSSSQNSSSTQQSNVQIIQR